MSSQYDNQPEHYEGSSVVETDYVPPCPHCRKPLQVIRKYLSRGFYQQEAIYSCDACGELLGIGYGIKQ
ncbi:MAG: hypothetical protein ACK47B_07395 [Armatimonadota bacterium]